MADSGTDDREERGERYSDRVSAPPPEFDDGPAGETRQTPKDELARWRRMAARGSDRSVGEPIGPHTPLEPGHDPASVTVPALDARMLGGQYGGGPYEGGPYEGGQHEVTRAVANPELGSQGDRAFAPWRPRAPEPPTREMQLSSDMVALSLPPEPRRDPTASLPPRAPPPRPALRPLATSVPPESFVVPSAAPLGVSALSVPPLSGAPAGPTSRRLAPLIAVGLVAVASGLAVAVVVWPDTSTSFAPSPPETASPSTPEATIPNPSTPPAAAAPTHPSTPPSTVPATNPSPPASVPTVAAAAPANPSVPAIALTPGPEANPSTPDASDPEALVDAGDAAFEARDYPAALSAYQRAIALDAHEAHAFEGAARTCIAMSRGVDAVRFAERAVAHRQRRAEYRVLLGDAHRLAGHLDEARAAWRHALTLDPDDASARARLE
jgi:hypothetical protein